MLSFGEFCYVVVLVSSPVAVIKSPDKSNSWEKGLFHSQGKEEEGKASRVHGHIVSKVKEQRS